MVSSQRAFQKAVTWHSSWIAEGRRLDSQRSQAATEWLCQKLHSHVRTSDPKTSKWRMIWVNSHSATVKEESFNSNLPNCFCDKQGEALVFFIHVTWVCRTYNFIKNRVKYVVLFHLNGHSLLLRHAHQYFLHAWHRACQLASDTNTTSHEVTLHWPSRLMC